MTHIKIIRNICYNVSPKLSVFITFQEVISQIKSCPPHLEHAALIVSDIQKSSHAQSALCGLALWKCDVVCRGVYGVRLRSSIFGRRACVYSKIFRDIPLVRTNAISKNSNNVVISSPTVLIFSWILVPYRTYGHVNTSTSGLAARGRPRFFSNSIFLATACAISEIFFRVVCPPDGP